jgi:hypothetical protein
MTKGLGRHPGLLALLPLCSAGTFLAGAAHPVAGNPAIRGVSVK